LGRNYQDELDEIAATSMGIGAPSKSLVRAIAASSAVPLVIIASGGAQIAARWMARLHLTTFGQPASVVTPLEARSLDAPKDAALWLISQGGQHADIMAAARWAVDASPLSTYALVGRTETPLAELVDAHGGLSTNLGMAPGADGFLTTNGLWAMLCQLMQAYRRHVTDAPSREEEALPIEHLLRWANDAAKTIPENDLRNVVTVVADPWTMIGAEDLQVRSTEAALAHVWATDYRNLGHGRHFWFADRAHDTVALFLSSADYRPLDAWTREGLPSDLATAVIPVPFEGALAGLASVAFSMHFTARLGARLHRDPGRPGVPSFGERLYGGTAYPTKAFISTSMAQRAVARKLGIPAAAVHEHTHRWWMDAWARFRDSLHQRPLHALVFDFDGTLVFSHHRWGDIPEDLAVQLRRLVNHGIYLGIATGRGDSVQPVLRKALLGCDLSRVIVGYHNGACVHPLEDPADDLDGPCLDPALTIAHTALETRLSHAAKIRCRAHQCTLEPKDRMTLKDLWLHARSVLDQDERTESLAVWLSSHSIDVCATGASKRNVITYLAELVPEADRAILRIGDRGSWPGNDGELLDHPCGISVDVCSLHPDHCWNLAKDVETGPAGALSVLQRLTLSEPRGTASLDLGEGA